MLHRLLNSIHQRERRWSKGWGTDISTPAGRRAARLHYHLADHGVLRGLWTNFYQIAPGVWRSNQPSPRRLARYRRMGIHTILNLRGTDRYSFYLFEREAAGRLGMEMIDIKLYARSLVPAARFAELFAIFDRIPRPFVMHCKSGADRAGLASALWLLDQEGASLAEARRQLHWRYAHLRHTRTGILDFLLDCYEDDCRGQPQTIRDWFANRYDPAAITADFEAMGKGRALPRPADGPRA